MENLAAQSQSEQALGQSGTTYQAVDISATDWTPDKPFKALHISGAGNVIIKGLDGVNSPAMAVVAGCWPYAGLAVIRTGTTATVQAAIF
jgi:hypothetical protein